VGSGRVQKGNAMKEQDRYDEVYTLFTRLSDRSRELSAEQHLGVMEAFNCLTDLDAPPSATLPVVLESPSEGTVEDLLAATAQALARLVDATVDSATALTYARSQSLLVASLSAR
jgi:hypothetical protein